MKKGIEKGKEVKGMEGRKEGKEAGRKIAFSKSIHRFRIDVNICTDRLATCSTPNRCFISATSCDIHCSEIISSMLLLV
jgi:hypothetical protein